MLSISAIETKLQELPKIELSYETFPSHRKVPPEYTIGLAIPRSKKYIAWFTFIEDQDVCLLLELNRDKQVVHAKQIQVEFDLDGPHMALGTFLYGSLSYVQDSDRAFFVIEDILMYKAVSLRKLCFGIRLGILEHLLSETKCLPMIFSKNSNNNNNIMSVVFTLPLMFPIQDTSPNLLNAKYKFHHLQYRSFTQILPYINVMLPSVESIQQFRPPSEQFRPPSYIGNKSMIDPIGKRAIFLVTADLQSDIYHLTRDVLDPNSTYTTDVAYIPNYTVSVFMNSLFRNIKENRNLDAIEESDDEDDFYDMRVDKYVDLSKEIRMECVYHKKFRRWIPYKTV